MNSSETWSRTEHSSVLGMTVMGPPNYSVEISLDDRNQFIGSLKLRRKRLLTRNKNVELKVTFYQLGHQSIERAATGGNELENLFAFARTLQCALDGLHLTLDATSSAKHLHFVFRGMRQISPLLNL